MIAIGAVTGLLIMGLVLWGLWVVADATGAQ